MRTSVRMPVLAAAAALLVPSLAVPAWASAASSGGAATSRPAPARQAPVPAARPGTGKRASAVAAALKLAKSSGKAVPVGSSSGSWSSVNPDGTFTVTVPASSKGGTYQVKIPSQLDGATVKSASVTAAVACSSPVKLALSVTSPGDVSLGSGSTWNSSSSAACSSSNVSLPLTGAVKQAAGHDWQSFAFRLSGAKASSPKLEVTYAQPAATPTGLAVSSSSLKDAGCASPSGSADSSSSPADTAGPSVSPGSAATMSAPVYDSAGAPEAARFTYWVKGSSKKTTVTSAPALSGQDATATIPASVTRGLGKNAVIDWTASAVDSSGSSASPASAACALTVDAEAEQGAPAISGGPASDPTPGTNVTWTVTAAAASQSGVTPTAVVWDIDNPPPTSDPSPDQTVQIASGSTSADVKVDIPSPGPHAFYAYVEYSDGSISSTATSQFTAANDPAVTCKSFADALTGTDCTGANGAVTSEGQNQMISNGANNSSGTASVDSGDRSYPASQLEAAGWNPGATIAVDGATFTLPQYGTSSSGDDNLFAAGQTIDLPTTLSSGTSLVFLVAGTNQDTTAPAPSQLGQPMSPPLPQGTPVTGEDCDRYQAALAGTNCTPAPEGTVNYNVDPSTGIPQSTQNYDLEAPDWAYTTPSISAVTLPDRSLPTGLDTTESSGIYAVSVPLDPGKTVSSVTLPDVGDVTVDGAGGDWPALHVLGVAVADTGTSTPGTLAGIPTVDAGDVWTGAWESPVEAPHAPYTGTSYDNQTVRIVTTASTSGFGVRLRLSDAVADAGSAPLSIGAVTVAQQSSGAAVTGTPVPVTFGGSTSVTIPEGGDVYSDPVLLPTASGGSPTVTAGEHLTVSIDLTGSYPALPTQTLCTACTEYVSASGSGDKTTDTTGSSFTGTGTVSGYFNTILSGVDTLTAGTPATASTPATVGTSTVAVLGDGIIDGDGPGTPDHGIPEVSDDLASSLALQPDGPEFGVVNAGIEANQVLASGSGDGENGGPAALSRLARDVLAEPDIGTVVIDEGEEDLLKGTSEEDLYTNGLMELSRELTAWGITTIWATQTACGGYASCTSAVDNARTTLNTDLLAQGLKPGTSCSAVGIPPCQYTADFATATGEGETQELGTQQQLAPADDVGDHVNLTEAGYLAETRTIPVAAGATPLTPNQPPSY